MADAIEGDNRTLRTAGRGGIRAPPTLRFSSKDSNGASLRCAVGGGSGAPITMDECEGLKKRIIMKDNGGGENGTLRTPGRGSSGAPPKM